MQQKKITFQRRVPAWMKAQRGTQGNYRFLREAQKFQKFGRTHSEGVLLVGTREQAKPLWRERLLARPTCRSSRFWFGFRRDGVGVGASGCANLFEQG